MEPQKAFEKIVEEYIHLEGVNQGKMMSSPAIQYKRKVFAFFHDNSMTFKLGKQFDPDHYGLTGWTYLNPFKNKPPMRGWIVVPPSQQDQWPFLTHMAYEFIKR